MNWFQKRLMEPSTHASIATALTRGSLAFPAFAPQLQAAAAVFAGLGVGLPEAGSAGNAATADTLRALQARIPPVQLASNPALADAINTGVQTGIQAAITKLLTPASKV
jgi:hypothetical protein